MPGENVISFEGSAGGARRRLASARVSGIVARCREQIVETLPKLMQDLFEHLDDDLYELADKSGSDALQTRYFEAMRELRKLRGPIEEAYLGGMFGGWDDFWDGRELPRSAVDVPDAEDHLELVANDELEENLAVANVSSKAENRFHRSLFALNLRFGHLADRGELDNDENPLSPVRMVGAFRRALDLWQGELPVKLVIFKLFDRHVMNYVGGLYDDINELLVAEDVLPKIVQKVRRNPVAPSVKRSREPEGDEAAAAEGGAVAEVPAELLSMLGTLLANRRQAQGTMLSPAQLAHLPVVPEGDLMGALSKLQQTTLTNAPDSLAEAQDSQTGVRTGLSQHLELGSPERPMRRLEQPDDDIIDVISMLFEFILEDRSLPDAMKALISRLQIPMLKVALLDRGFFSKKTHPARHLLNNLARAAVGWVDDGDRSPNSLYGRIESVVTRILTDFEDDLQLFRDLDQEFSEFLERENRGAEVAEQRITQVTRGQEQLRLARQRVADVISDCLRVEPVPPKPVRSLLESAWKDVMLLAFLREGEDSEAWQQTLEVAHRLVWSVAPKTGQAQRQDLLKTIPELLKALREGLANISYDQHKSVVLFKELQACHIAALRGTSCATPEDAAAAEAQAAAAEEPMEEVVLSSTVAEEPEADKYLDRADAMQVGQWLEWRQEDDTQVRAKLSWKSEVSGHYVFVNRKGLKVAEMTRAGIAALFRAERAQLIEQANAPLMDRALSAMLAALKRTSPPAAGSPLPA